MNIVTVAQMRALEAAAVAAGTSEAELQQRAGAAVAEEVWHIRQQRGGGRVVVLVGHGNNGRDGAVAAEWLLRRGAGVDLILAPRHAVTPDELQRLSALGAGLVASDNVAGVRNALTSASIALDALAGIGATGALREPLSTLATQLNDAHIPRVVALDLPSGVDADTGAVAGEAVTANATVTLGAIKQGLLRFPAAERVGTLIPREIGLAPGDTPYVAMNTQTLRSLAPARPLEAHKYRFGRTLVIAGSDHFLGAPVLCAGGAARVGAGLITVGSTRDVRLNVAAHLPEATFTQHDVRAADGAQAGHQLQDYLKSHNAVVIGPGLGRGPEVTAFVAEVLSTRPQEHAIVVDADGLVALAELDDWPTRLGRNAVLTPHTGELQRLTGEQVPEPLWVTAAGHAQRWGCVLVAKGPFTCVASPDGRAEVWPHANAALATGGTGDVLAGVTGGLLAQGLSPWDAARLAVGVHALAAQRIVERRGWRTLLASDLFWELPQVLAELSQPR